MLEVKDLSKTQNNCKINNIDFNLSKGEIVSIECGNEISELLISLIIGIEMPEKGQIWLCGMPNLDFMKIGIKNVGVIYLNEGYNERLTVKEYLKFCSELIDSKRNCNEIMMKFGLLDIGKTKISKLSYSQKRRLSFAREYLKDLNLLILQEPILNMDQNNIKIILETIQELSEQGVAILNLSVSYKDILLLGGQSYSIDDNGICPLEPQVETKHVNTVVDEPPIKLNKITAKLGDRIVLFNPTEIDYIESVQGESQLHVRGDQFISMYTLNELENRLKNFGFFRAHRSYIVNLQKVREIITYSKNSYSITLDDKLKSTIPLSKGRIEELKYIMGI